MDRKILGIGSPLLDYLCREEETFIAQYNLIKSGMSLVEGDKIEEIAGRLKEPVKSPGGSAANTICGLAKMGAQCGFCGKIGADSMGEFLSDNFRKDTIANHLLTTANQVPTGQVVSIITPDSERTFATYLGAALYLEPDDIQPQLFDGYTDVYIEGYLIANHELMLKICRLAKENGCRISLDTASFNVVDEHKDFFLEILLKYIDIVFANEEEAASLTGKQEEEALVSLQELCETAVVKLGKKGSLVAQAGKITRIPIELVDGIDTTGAGDLYAAGFLLGLFNNKPLETCGRLGGILSKHVVMQYGAYMPPETWDTIRQESAELLGS